MQSGVHYHYSTYKSKYLTKVYSSFQDLLILWVSFEKRDTYLIYDDKQTFLRQLGKLNIDKI